MADDRPTWAQDASMPQGSRCQRRDSGLGM